MNRLADTVKRLKRSDPSPRICPSCGSTNIREHGSLGGWLIPSTFVCDDCGYAGGVVLEVDQPEPEV